MLSVLTDKSSHEETRLLRDHKEEVEDLHKDLNERDEKIDELVEDYQMQLQVNQPFSARGFQNVHLLVRAVS